MAWTHPFLRIAHAVVSVKAQFTISGASQTHSAHHTPQPRVLGRFCSDLISLDTFHAFPRRCGAL